MAAISARVRLGFTFGSLQSSLKSMEPHRIYRNLVLPFAGFMAIGSAVIMALTAFSTFPITYCPFVCDESAQRILIGFLAAIQIILGVGLTAKLRFAWFGMVAYLLVGTIFEALAFTFEPPSGDQFGVALFATFAVISNGLIGAIVYGIKPVFQKRPPSANFKSGS